MTSVLVVDDHPIVVRGCRIVLEALGVDEMYEAMNVITAFRAYVERKPDVAVVDLTLEGDSLGGLSLIRRIVEVDKKAKILVFSMHNDPNIVSRALQVGALSFVLKDGSSDELAAAFEKAVLGEPYLSHKLAMKIAMLRSHRDEQMPTHVLTAREMQILEMLSRGNDYDKIAKMLGLSYKTVINSCSAMRTKLKIDSLAGLIWFAVQNSSGHL